MAATYKQFLASPSADLLADKASLHYLTTTTSVSGPEEIIKHLTGLQKHLTKKKEDILNTVDARTSAAFEIDTGLEFLLSGGPYLPGLDDNFVTDHVVYFPVNHFVSLAEDGKISQIRLSWDQGSLLKQLEVIGKTGRNWPIKDSREQLALIQSSVKASGDASAASAKSHGDLAHRSRGSSSHALRDPHTTLHMQPTREELDSATSESFVAPYGGSRPQPRRFEDILGDNPDGNNYDYRQEPSPAKVGQGKNLTPMRIFDGQEDAAEEDSPKPRPNSQYIRPDSRKYEHFDFADGSDPADAPKPSEPRPKSKHDSQWSFDDFVTPAKPKFSKAVRHQEVRHWAVDEDVAPAPQHAGKGRRDAETHFELQDDGEQVPKKERARQKGSVHNDGLGLYKNNLFAQEGGAATDAPDERTLGNITNLKDRGKDFEAHWEMRDDSPAQTQAPRPQHIPEHRQKAVKMMDSHWEMKDEPLEQEKENTLIGKGPVDDNRIHIAGDGMGGKKGTNRDWLYGDNGDFEADMPKPAPSRVPRSQPVSEPRKKGDDGRIHIAGDGMGGKKGTNRDWLYGDGQE